MDYEDNKKRRELLVSAGIILLLLIGIPLLNGSFFIGGFGDSSKGVRIGTVVKFSERGWFWKTWEGEMAMGAFKGSQAITSYIFEFSVCDKDPKKIEAINTLVAKSVEIKYSSPALWFRWNQGSKYCVEEIRPLA